MAIYKSYGSSSYQQAAQTAAQYLEALGIFESVSLTDSTISCAFEDKVVTITYSNGGVDATFGSFTFHAGDIATFWIGSAANGVFLSHTNTFVSPTDYKLYTLAFGKSLGGLPMLIVHELGMSNSHSYVLAIDAQGSPVSVTDGTLSQSPYYSNLVGICTTDSGAETVAAADRIFRYADRQTNVPIDSLCVVSIGGAKFMTDGYIAVSDE